MKSFYDTYAVVGGDLRQVYLAAELSRTGCSVCCHALCRPIEQVCPDSDAGSVLTVSSFEEACRNAACILCPIPLSKDGIFLNQNRTKKNIPLNQFLLHLTPKHRFFAGCIPKEFRAALLKKGVFSFDFMKDAVLNHFNSLATAEGVICEAIRLSPKNLHKSKCAVLGYGVCGRTITDYLKRMYCRVSAVAAPVAERAQAALVADEALDPEAFFSRIGEYDFIFNTIPAVLLTGERLRDMKPDAVILDIASAPGGVDFAAAKKLSVTALACPGLPGRYAPLSSARAILASINYAKTEFERS